MIGFRTPQAGVAAFCRKGAKVVVADLDGERAAAVAVDVTKEDDCRQMAETAVESFGGLDIVWANAGIATPELEDIAMAALYLASDEASVVTGLTMAIDSGASA